MKRAATSPRRSAGSAGLRYVTDDEPGITRRRRGQGFQYLGADGTPLSARERERVKALAIPPAWTDVWICRSANGHLQATGRDSRGRKQYRYHDRWAEVRDRQKYERTVRFARALPRIRRRVDRDMARKRLVKDKVVATVVHLLDVTNIRVGNDEYARENRSFGLTTLQDRHVDVHGGAVRFHFPGKGGKVHEVEVSDARVARAVARCEELPGQQLFQYLDGNGQLADVHSDDVNDYLQRAAGEEFTAKDFRTWSGTVLAAWALEELGEAGSDAQARKQMAAAVESVATQLGNTPAVCRRCYIHPEIFDAHVDRTLCEVLDHEVMRRLTGRERGLTRHEAAALALISRRVDRTGNAAPTPRVA